MLASRVLRNLKVQPQRLVRFMGGDAHGHHGPLMPPFARLRPPSKTVSLNLLFFLNFSLIFF